MDSFQLSTTVYNERDVCALVCVWRFLGSIASNHAHDCEKLLVQGFVFFSLFTNGFNLIKMRALCCYCFVRISLFTTKIRLKNENAVKFILCFWCGCAEYQLVRVRGNYSWCIKDKHKTNLTVCIQSQTQVDKW